MDKVNKKGLTGTPAQNSHDVILPVSLVVNIFDLVEVSGIFKHNDTYKIFTVHTIILKFCYRYNNQQSLCRYHQIDRSNLKS